jgi:hypothetical protein
MAALSESRVTPRQSADISEWKAGVFAVGRWEVWCSDPRGGLDGFARAMVDGAVTVAVVRVTAAWTCLCAW